MVSRVASDCGVVVGSATRTATPGAWSIAGGDTSAMPGSAAIAAARGAEDGRVAGETSTATTSGPLAPGPNPSAIRS